MILSIQMLIYLIFYFQILQTLASYAVHLTSYVVAILTQSLDQLRIMESIQYHLTLLASVVQLIIIILMVLVSLPLIQSLVLAMVVLASSLVLMVSQFIL